jgi:hypothetical protein
MENRQGKLVPIEQTWRHEKSKHRQHLWPFLTKHQPPRAKPQSEEDHSDRLSKILKKKEENPTKRLVDDQQ